MKNICHNFYRKIIFNASALSHEEISPQPWKEFVTAVANQHYRSFHPIISV